MHVGSLVIVNPDTDDPYFAKVESFGPTGMVYCKRTGTYDTYCTRVYHYRANKRTTNHHPSALREVIMHKTATRFEIL